MKRNSYTTTIMPAKPHCGYNAGHPWYYFLGGKVPTLKQIQADAVFNGYRGYARDDIQKVDAMQEPRRSERLREYQAKFKADLSKDVSRYREVVRELHQNWLDNPCIENRISCDEVHTSMSLKYCHIYNNFGHLHYLDQLLGKQRDLFDL